ncbi:MAG TPA: ATP-binding cassette domain-containing protein [Candidatus Acidoferrum sp.]|nr:ATP-binding cassette domain-containing protein [Candidatus Acidoferrum sp.]
MTKPIIEFRHVEYLISTIPSRSILSDVSLQIHPGETIALLGRSGSGKTTLLKLINGLRFPSSGTLQIQDRSVRDWDLIQLRRSIGYVIQEVGLFPHLTVRENVCLVPQLENWPADRISSRYVEVLQSVSLSPAVYSNRYPRELSGGQRQRVGVARALAADPKILLMDEPFGALDPVTRAELQREFLRLAAHMANTVVLVTHDVREALLLATRIVLLDSGRIIAIAAPSEFARLTHPVAREFLAAAELSTGASS